MAAPLQAKDRQVLFKVIGTLFAVAGIFVAVYYTIMGREWHVVDAVVALSLVAAGLLFWRAEWLMKLLTIVWPFRHKDSGGASVWLLLALASTGLFMVGTSVGQQGANRGPRPRFDPPVVRVVGDSLEVTVTIDHPQITTLDSFNLRHHWPGATDFLPQPGPFTGPVTVVDTVGKPPPQGTWNTGRFCGGAWKTGSDGVSRTGGEACSPTWTYTNPDPVPDTLPPVPPSFGAPSVLEVGGVTPPPPVLGPYEPEPPRITLNTTSRPVEVRTVAVAPGGLQAAANAAQCGDALILQAGRTYGRLVLPDKPCAAQPITIRTDGTLPPKGQRIWPSDASQLARLFTTTMGPVLDVASTGTHGWHLLGLEITGRSTSLFNGRPMVWYGVRLMAGNQWTADTTALPSHITLEQVYVHSDDDAGMRRCVALSGYRLAVIDSYLANCKDNGPGDSQAIGGWGGRGVYKIDNTYLEGAGENFMLGGIWVRDSLATPSDIEFTNNYVRKPPSWDKDNPDSGFVGIPGSCGSAVCAWTVKNLFELKVAKRVLVRGNFFEHNWGDSQAGKHAVLFQNVDSIFAQIRDVMFRDNVIAYAPGATSACGNNGRGGPPCERIAVVNNLWLLHDDPGGNDLQKLGPQVTGPTQGLRFAKNTLVWITSGHAAMTVHGSGRAGLVYADNVICQTTYLATTNGAVNYAAILKADSLATVQGNVYFDASPPPLASRPPGNIFVGTNCAVPSIAVVLADYSNIPDASAYVGTDGLTPGVDVARLPNITRVRAGR